MHTYSHREGNVFLHFDYNSDFSGNVIVTRQEIGEDAEGDEEVRDQVRFFIPGKLLLDFVAFCYIMPNRIDQIMKMEAQELLQ